MGETMALPEDPKTRRACLALLYFAAAGGGDPVPRDDAMIFAILVSDTTDARVALALNCMVGLGFLARVKGDRPSLRLGMHEQARVPVSALVEAVAMVESRGRGLAGAA